MSRDSLPPLEDEFTRALLGSAEADAPSSAAYTKAAATLGVAIGVGASLPAAAAVGAAGVAGAARWSGSLGAKLLLGFSGALLVGGAGTLLLRRSAASQTVARATTVQHRPAAVASGAVSRSVTAARAVRDGTRQSPVAVTSSAVNLAAATRTKRAPALPAHAPHSFAALPNPRRVPAPAPAPAPAATGSSLAEQVQSLDRARVALASGAASSALAEIARYRATWPTGVFLTEASVLEIEALAVHGERSRARVLAAQFVAAHPDSPQADRLRALVPAAAPSPP